MNRDFKENKSTAEKEEKLILSPDWDNPEVFFKLYDQFSPALFGLILKWVKDPKISEALLQRVFVKAWEKRHLYNASNGRVFTWLYGITFQACNNYLQSKV